MHASLARAALVPAIVLTGLLLDAPVARAQGEIHNPVVATDAPDPGAIRVGDTYYVVTTSGNARDSFPIRSSPDLAHWQDAGSIFPAGSPGRPTWATSDFWAPEIHAVGDHFVACYTARDASGRLCVGLATAPAATGPYTDSGTPVVRDDKGDARHGVIDPTLFQDTDGVLYLYWKSDGNAHGARTKIFGQKLDPVLLTPEGSPTQLIENDRKWEGKVVEAPWVEEHDGLYYLFYSGNSYADASYAVGVARGPSPLGPFEKARKPILKSNATFSGPGHMAIVTDPAGQDFMVFHAWLAGQEGDGHGPGRELLVNRVRWENGWPAVSNGSPAVIDVGPAPADPAVPR